MSEVTVRISLDGRKGLMEIKDKPYKFASEERHKEILLNRFQNLLNYHTERYPQVCRDYAEKNGYTDADYIKLFISGGPFGDTPGVVRSKIGGPNEE